MAELWDLVKDSFQIMGTGWRSWVMFLLAVMFVVWISKILWWISGVLSDRGL